MEQWGNHFSSAVELSHTLALLFSYMWYFVFPYLEFETGSLPISTRNNLKKDHLNT